MHSHFLLLIVFAFFVSTVFATLMREDIGQQIRFGAVLFGGFVVGAVAFGWLMFPIPL